MLPSADSNGSVLIRRLELEDDQRPIELAFSEAHFGTEKAFKFPISPIISVEGSNELALRHVNSEEQGGLVAEQWSRGNYELTLEGAFVNDEDMGWVEGIDGQLRAYGAQLAHDYVSQLTDFLTAKRALYILSSLTDRVGIYTIAIKSWSFPMKRGQGFGHQHFTIRAVSLGVAQDLFITTPLQPAFQSPVIGDGSSAWA